MERDIQEILISEEQIRSRIKELGEILTAEYEGKNPVVIGVLTMLFGRDWLVETWASDPPAAASYSLLMLLLGYMAARLVDFCVRARRDKEVDSARDAELKAMAVRIEQLPVGEKLNVKMAYLGRSNKMGGKSADTFLKHSAEPLKGIVYAVPLVMGEIELKLTDDGRAAVEAHPECLDAVPKLKGE